ncbi:MAG: AAA domain-containing protein, partial [Treponemataceae bacterium]|nr:AAA domain-containing protein [Treponemataceae bacterium]
MEKITPFVDWFSLMFEKTENIKGLEVKDLSLRASNCFEHIEQLENWIDYNISRQKLVDMDLGDFVLKIEENAISHKNILPVFEKRFFRLWIDLVIKDFPEVENFRINKQETLIEDFCNLDKKLFLINKGRIKAKLINDLPSLDSFTTGEVNILKKELGKQRKIMPIRQLFSQIPNLLTTLKPCLMMSPLTVSQFLESELYTFDTVIFDEASQVKTENALGAILRGKQLIIAGDRHQLPPTNFFEVQSQDD